MLSVGMQVVTFGLVKLSAIMSNAIMLNVLAPSRNTLNFLDKKLKIKEFFAGWAGSQCVIVIQLSCFVTDAA
jgi:hypothetical protein